jgi:hypothetical protein
MTAIMIITDAPPSSTSHEPAGRWAGFRLDELCALRAALSFAVEDLECALMSGHLKDDDLEFTAEDYVGSLALLRELEEGLAARRAGAV